MSLTLQEVIDSAVGPMRRQSMGYMNPGGGNGIGYIATMKLSVGKVAINKLDRGTEGIVSYDRCEKNDAYIGQINMLTASSFCGVNGALWGFDLARADDIASAQPKYFERGKHGTSVPVYSADPLLDATVRLFGVKKQRRFNPLPGAMVVCANKSYTSTSHEVKKGTWVWSAIAIAIPVDRTTQASLFIEDAGSLPYAYTADDVQKTLRKSIHAVTRSVLLCGEDQDVDYSAIYVSTRQMLVPPNYVGCALTCAPYVVLAKDAIPRGARPSALIGMTISEWELALELDALPRRRR